MEIVTTFFTVGMVLSLGIPILFHFIMMRYALDDIAESLKNIAKSQESKNKENVKTVGMGDL